jgi:hypothetical protein
MTFKGGFDGVKGNVPVAVRQVLLKMGWTEYNAHDSEHNQEEINLMFIKRPKLQDLPLMLG